MNFSTNDHNMRSIALKIQPQEMKSVQEPWFLAAIGATTEIRMCEKTDGKSLYATVDFGQEQILSKFSPAKVLERPNYLTVQITDNQHVMLDPEFLQYINHSCEPNVFFDTRNMVVTALREIKMGEELTFFYPSTEWSMDRGFDCRCASKDCIGRIQGAAHLPLNIATEYKLSQYIEQKLGNVQAIK